VVSPELNKKSIYGNSREITKKTKLYEADLQLTAFPSDVFYNETFIDPGFIQEIKRTGKRIYTKEGGLDLSCL
jgi:hypothetical protein